ncbi:MAG: hypothetical protein ACI4PM_02890 [Butyricicoccus sp.]
MDPQQELFSTLLTAIKEKGYDVYDGMLPPDDAPYPFVYLADSRQTDDPNKSAIFGDVSQTIHVWHNSPKKRGTVSAMLGEIKQLCRALHYTTSFAWDLRNVNQRILTDTTTETPLLHGVLELEFKFCGR